MRSGMIFDICISEPFERNNEVLVSHMEHTGVRSSCMVRNIDTVLGCLGKRILTTRL